MRVLVAGGGAREHAIAYALVQSGGEVVVAAPIANPGLVALSKAFGKLDPTQPGPTVEFARTQRVDLAVIGPEAPLSAGLGDALRAASIPVVGPSKDGARIESSKRYCRDLLEKYRIPGAPKVVPVSSLDEVDARVAEFHVPFVVKPVGLTSGKGVAVQGLDFQTAQEGASYAKQLLASGGGSGGVLLEERVEGEEFSLMAFVTDSGIYPMPLVHDYKRSQAGDVGGNTGGMGAFSQRDHLLPFVSTGARERALDILGKTVGALRSEGITYRGILYGGFMMTSQGPILLEYNARFGDPEGINVLTLYEPGNFVDLLYGVATGHVNPSLVRFRPRATVVRYIVPPGYPTSARMGGVLEIDSSAIERLGLTLRYGAVESTGGGRVTMSTSRALALVGEASAIAEAAARVEAGLAFVRGEYQVRHDIGTREDLGKRTEHVRALFVPGVKPSPLPLSVAPPEAPPSSAGTAEQVI